MLRDAHFLTGLLALSLLTSNADAQAARGGSPKPLKPKLGGVHETARVPLPGVQVETDVLDFEGLPAGTIVSEVFGANGLGPVQVWGIQPDLGDMVNAAVIFDSSMRTGGDDDLGTPNSDFGGPGLDAELDGFGGEAGSPYQNDTPQGNLLILGENLDDVDMDGLVDDPDDGDWPFGARTIFTWPYADGVTVESMMIIDVETEEGAAVVEFFDAMGDPVAPAAILPQVGDNGVGTLELGVSGVHMMVVSINGSGAIDDIEFSVEQPCDGLIGDFVWLDEDCDGIQDDGEPGIPGVRVLLFGGQGGLIAETLTGPDGSYSFEGLCEGAYRVEVDPTTLPDGYEPAPCDAGDDDERDNDCSGVFVVLEPGEQDRSIDFGYCEPDDPMGGTGGCTPGYWKQSHHFDSWPDDVSPDMAFAEVFDDAFPGKTLLDVLKQGGGGLKALGRHTVAAYLNASVFDYGGLSPDDVVEHFNDAYADGEYEDLKNHFDYLSNALPCTLN